MVSQGQITVASIDDKEELVATDVSVTPEIQTKVLQIKTWKTKHLRLGQEEAF